ncbi:hydantoinase/oxoprolinase family protein [Spirillospora sp. CA-294931]|uniref:hydantoinase/oxoprolinase family protein n=1 Tax=Spirillospora sp. CA-294931 TaxID=3240042 RepID=UPI003D8A9A5D
MTLRIGIDVGGTNTDAVAIDGTEVVAACKFPTTANVLGGVARALRHIVAETGTDRVHSVVIGTTHFVNAVTEATRLTPVIAIRLATPPQPLPPFTDWPDRLRDLALGEVHVLPGGHQFTGEPLNDLDLPGVRAVTERAADAGHRDYVVSSVFSPINAGAELAARDVILDVCPDARVTLSHRLGRIGLLERENAALLNGALRPLAAHVTDGFARALHEVGLDAPLYLSQNDGTVMNLETAREFPILTAASGPTNSMRGAALESGRDDCVVVDVGGTTTDIGLLRAGFPRESSLAVDLGGVRTNFRMPDVISLGIGGGSLVRGVPGAVTIGPDSVGYEIDRRALVFGGRELTLTDVVVAAGLADIGDAALVAHLDPVLVQDVLDRVTATVAEHVDRAKLEPGDVPVVVVGGGGVLLGDRLPGASVVLRPSNAAVANAIGAATATVGGEVDRVYSLAGSSREEALRLAREDAFERAVAAGAIAATVRIVDEEDVPLAHLPDGTATRIRVRAVGDSMVTDATGDKETARATA